VIERYRRLAERLRSELPDIDREVARAQGSWTLAQSTDDPEPFIDSVALNLHGFYTGVERLLETIATQVDSHQPGGSDWHRRLLDTMAEPVPDVRPAVLRRDTVQGLDGFRRFRHLVRNVYTSRLIPERMLPLLETLPPVWEHVQSDLLKFADFLDRLSHADEAAPDG
jgi:hypothetical protein